MERQSNSYKRYETNYKNCKRYKNFLRNQNINIYKINKNYDFPFIHVNSFKDQDLLSINKNKIFKTLFSSGTSNQKLSKIHLDKINAKNQIIALKKIVCSILGNSRLPMLIFEKDPKILEKRKFGAKIATQLNLPIAWVNEHSSTWQAATQLNLRKDKSGQLDSAAAALLLEQWLQEGPELKPVKISPVA